MCADYRRSRKHLTSAQKVQNRRNYSWTETCDLMWLCYGCHRVAFQPVAIISKQCLIYPTLMMQETGLAWSGLWAHWGYTRWDSSALNRPAHSQNVQDDLWEYLRLAPLLCIFAQTLSCWKFLILTKNVFNLWHSLHINQTTTPSILRRIMTLRHPLQSKRHCNKPTNVM